MMISQCIVLSLEQLVQLSGAADVASFHMFVYKMRPCGYVSAIAQDDALV